jgi:hypothetical protein
VELPEFLPELAEPSTPRCFNLLVEHTKQLTSLDEAKMAEKMTTAEMMREYNRMRLERGDSSVSAPAAGSENPELAQMIVLLDEAGSLLEKASYEAMTVAGTAEQYAMFTATWAVKYYRAEVKKLLVTAVHTGAGAGDGDLINVLTSGANRAAKLEMEKALRKSVGDTSTIQKVLGLLDESSAEAVEQAVQAGCLGWLERFLPQLDETDLLDDAAADAQIAAGNAAKSDRMGGEPDLPMTQLLGTLADTINSASEGLQETKRQSVSAADSWKKLSRAPAARGQAIELFNQTTSMQLLRECMRELGEEFDSYTNCMNLKAAMTKFKNKKTEASKDDWVAAAKAKDGAAIPALVDAEEMEKRMKMNNTHIAEIEEQISTRVLKFANKRVSSKKQVDKAGQKEGLTGLVPLELRKFEDPDANKSARFKEVVMKWLTTLAAQFPVLTVILSVCFEANPSIHDEVLFPTFRRVFLMAAAKDFDTREEGHRLTPISELNPWGMTGQATVDRYHDETKAFYEKMSEVIGPDLKGMLREVSIGEADTPGEALIKLEGIDGDGVSIAEIICFANEWTAPDQIELKKVEVYLVIHTFYEGKSLNTAIDDAIAVVNECLLYGAQIKWSTTGALWAKAIAANFADVKTQIIQEELHKCKDLSREDDCVSELKPFLERVRRIADENKKLQAKGKRPAKGHSMYLNERAKPPGGRPAGVDQHGRINQTPNAKAPNGRCMAKGCCVTGSTMQKPLSKQEKTDWQNFAKKMEKYKGQGRQPTYFPICKQCRTKMTSGTDIQHMDGRQMIKGRTQVQKERTAMQAAAIKTAAAAPVAAPAAPVAAPAAPAAPAPAPAPVAAPAPAPSPATIAQPVAAVAAAVETELERMKRLNDMQAQELEMMKAQQLQFYRMQQMQQDTQGQQLAIANQPHNVHEIQMAEARLEVLKKNVTSSALALQNMQAAPALNMNSARPDFKMASSVQPRQWGKEGN